MPDPDSVPEANSSPSAAKDDLVEFFRTHLNPGAIKEVQRLFPAANDPNLESPGNRLVRAALQYRCQEKRNSGPIRSPSAVLQELGRLRKAAFDLESILDELSAESHAALTRNNGYSPAVQETARLDLLGGRPPMANPDSAEGLFKPLRKKLSALALLAEGGERAIGEIPSGTRSYWEHMEGPPAVCLAKQIAQCLRLSRGETEYVPEIARAVHHWATGVEPPKTWRQREFDLYRKGLA